MSNKVSHHMKGLPMAKFYQENNYPGVKISAYPSGWRNIGVYKFRPFRKIPYQSQTTIPFEVRVEYEESAETDFREFAIYREKIIITMIHSENNQGREHSQSVEDGAEHDDNDLIYQIHFPRKGDWVRLVYSHPLESNFGIILVGGAILGVLGSILVGWILYYFGWI